MPDSSPCRVCVTDREGGRKEEGKPQKKCGGNYDIYSRYIHAIACTETLRRPWIVGIISWQLSREKSRRWVADSSTSSDL